MIGVFPPPLMGMATINDAMKKYLSEHGHDPVVINMTYRSLSKAWYVRIRRLIQLPIQLARFSVVLCRGRRPSVYMSLSAGYGQLFEIPFILLSRLTGAKLSLHHHSVLYINHPTHVSRLLMRLAGKSAMHIVLCQCMADTLRTSYVSAASVSVLSNAAFLSLAEASRHARGEVRTLGFLSNIELDKGIMEFLAVVERLESDGHSFRAMVAGPFRNPDEERLIRSKLDEMTSVEYVGPKYDEEKVEFFSSIDVLLYPTKNDAEPLTVLEAMAHGVPVIANNRGCIEEMLAAKAGVVVSPDDDFVDVASRQLLAWKVAPGSYAEVALLAKARFDSLRDASLGALNQLYSDGSGRHWPDA